MNSQFLAVLTIAFLLFATSTNSIARQSSLPENAAGARSLALGQSALASGNDALSISFNPANASNLQRSTASFYYSELPLTGVNTSVGIILPSTKHGVFFGLSLYHLGVGNIEARDSDGNVIDSFGYRQDHLLLTYAKKFSPKFSAGFNAKFVRQSYAKEVAGPENAGIDIGAQYTFHHKHALLNNLIFGFAVDNLIQPTLTLDKEREYLPREARVILEKNLKIASNNLLLVSNWRFTDASFIKGRTFHFGAEYSYRSRIFMRAGGHTDNTITLGAGLKMWGICLDYVHGSQIPNSLVRQNSLSASVEFF